MSELMYCKLRRETSDFELVINCPLKHSDVRIREALAIFAPVQNS